VAGRRVAGAARGAETTGLVDGGDAVVQNAKMIRERADELTQRPVKKAKQ
jgi:hypothetical protein